MTQNGKIIPWEQPHRTPVVVRGYELDSYGHLNNAVYLQYLEHGRWMMMKDLGLLGQIEDGELMLVVTETRIRYLQEALLLDDLVVETNMKVENPFLVFRQKIINVKTGVVLSRACVKTIFVNRQRMPLDVPAFIHQNFSSSHRAKPV